MEHSCKQRERHVASGMASGAYAGGFLAIPCSCSKEEPTSCPQSLASCCNTAQPEREELADRLAGPSLGLCHEHLPFPLPAPLFRLQCSPPAPSLPPTPSADRSSSPLGVRGSPHSLGHTFAFLPVARDPHFSAIK